MKSGSEKLRSHALSYLGRVIFPVIKWFATAPKIILLPQHIFHPNNSAHIWPESQLSLFHKIHLDNKYSCNSLHSVCSN